MTRSSSAVLLRQVLLVAGVAPAALGQRVQGVVTSRSTGKPVMGGRATLLGEAARLVGDTTTNRDGRYHLAAPVAGRYRVRFEAPGYRVLVSPPFDLHPLEIREIPLRVAPLPPVALATVIVSGRPVPRYLEEFYRHKATGLGKFVTAEEFERYQPVVLTDVLKQEGAFWVSAVANVGAFHDFRRYRINSRRALAAGFGPVHGECPPLVFLDGTLVGNTYDINVDDIVSLWGLEALEFYEGVGIPGEYQLNGSSCGVIAGWSKRGVEGEPGPVVHHVEVGVQLGERISSTGLSTGRAGVQGGIGLVGPLEAHAAFNALIAGLHGSLDRRGWQAEVDLRARPFGGETPWYVGAGATTLSLSVRATWQPRRTVP